MTKTTITRATLESMTLAGLADVYNQYAAKPVKKFSCSRTAAIEKVIAVLPVVEAKPAKTKGAMGIGARTVVMLKDGLKPADVLEALRAEFGTEVSSIASVYWYKSRLNRGIEA